MPGLAQKILKLAGILAIPARRALFVHGVAAGVEHLRVLRQFGDCRTVVDIGANKGQFALAARHVFRDALIHSFEPLPGPSAKFQRVFRADSRVQLHEAAIGPEGGEAAIHVSGHDDSSSLLPIGNEQDRLFPGTAECRVEKIRVGRLRDFIAAGEVISPALLKLDVQGFELEVLLGCEDLLLNFDQVYAECSFVELYEGQALADEVIAWLRGKGFVLGGMYNATYDSQGRAIQADFMFTRRVLFEASD